MIGVPPTAGFLGKWFMLTGAMETEQWLPVLVIIASTLLNAGYFLPIVVQAFFRAPGEDVKDHAKGEAPLPIVLAVTATAVGTVWLFFSPEIPLALSTMLAGM
jgi:multicomponent Na+:H+ antiporter subunit D